MPSTFNKPGFDSSWQRQSQGRMYGPVTETLTPATGNGVNSSILDANQGYRWTFYLENTTDQSQTARLNVGYAKNSGETALNPAFATASSVTLAAGNVTPQYQYVTLTDFHGFAQINVVSGGSVSVGTLKVTVLGGANQS